jgi:SAM-dependent methyltransferase
MAARAPFASNRDILLPACLRLANTKSSQPHACDLSSQKKTSMEKIKNMHYTFEHVSTCEMCGSPDSRAQVLGQRMNCRQGLATDRLQGVSVTIKRCRKCGLIYCNPIPVPCSLDAHYGVPPESYWNEEFFSYNPIYFQEQIKAAKSHIKTDWTSTQNPPPLALDIGCGVGKALKSLEAEGFIAYGIEPSAPFRERALKFTGFAAERIQHSSIENANLPQSKFDFITFGAVFEHLYHPARALSSALEWCKPNGIIHIEVPSSRWLIEHLYHRILKLKGSELTSFLSPMHVPYHLYSFSRASFSAAADRMGFQIVETRIDPCTVYYAPPFTKGAISKLMRWTGTGMQLTVYLRKAA